MLFLLDKFRKFLINQKTINKSIQAFMFDIGIYILIYIFFKNQIFTNSNEITFYVLFCFLNSFLFLRYGYYKNKIKFINFESFNHVLVKLLILLFLLNIIFFLNYKVWSFALLIAPLNVIMAIHFTRMIFKSILYESLKFDKENILIYGAGSAGVQLLDSINSSNKHNVVAFLDDSPKKNNTKINNISIFPSEKFEELIKNHNISLVFIAIPSLRFDLRKEILKKLLDKKFNIKIKILPAIDDLIGKNINFDLMQDMTIEDIIGRKVVSPHQDLLEKNIINKTVLITGAAGTIGSELCLKIIENNPKKIIMVDSSEIGLFNLMNKLKDCHSSTEFLLGDLKDRIFIQNFLNEFNEIDIAYHVAAYKHVNILESNQLPGFYNNVVIIKNLIDGLLKNTRVKQFVNVSTDKAVAPSTIMGLSKYYCELIVNEYSKKTNIEFSIVRFGNVLKSSGSVLTIFDKQIKNRAPITVTDRNVKRFFMSVEEAVSLIIQSSALKGKNRRFVLDMGEQLSIYKIAERMIFLNGFSLKNKDNPNGDIEIKITGLQTGEKLEEELYTLSGKLVETEHSMISKINENLPELNLENFFKLLEENYINNNVHYLSELMKHSKGI